MPSVVELRYLLSNWISRLESDGQIREPRLPITGTTVVLLSRYLSLSNDNKNRERDETDALVAFYTDRGVGYKYRPKKKGKKSQNINFETSDQFTQSGLTESRKGRSGNSLTLCIQYRDPNWNHCWFQGHKPIPLQWVDIDKNEHKQRREGWSSCCSVVQKSIGQPWRSGGNHWC